MPHFTGALEPVARIAVATLFNSLWEAALLAFAVWLILRALPNLNATTRYAAWCVALVASLLLPLATALPQISVQQSFVHHAKLPVKSLPVTFAATHRAPTKTAAPKTAVTRTAASAVQTAPATRPAFRMPRLRFAVPQYVALGLFVAWLLAAIALLVRLGINLYRLERLKADALPLPVDYRERLARWSSAEKGGRDVRLCICDGIEVPVAVGLFDSMILIPQHLLDTLLQEEVDQIMLHELAHLRRADDWTNGIQRFIQALFFFNPAVLYIAQQLDLEREVACDDWVVHQTQEVRPYATCLTKMAEVTAWPHRALAAPGVFLTRRGLSVRVERLLRAGRNVRTSVAFGPAGGVVAALVVLFFVLQTVAPTFAFTLPEEKAAVMVASAATAAPSPAPSKHTGVHTQYEHVKTVQHADPNGNAGDTQTIDVPATHVHVKGETIRTPDVNIDIPARHIVMKKVATHFVTPPVMPNISAVTSKTIDAAMKTAFDASHMRNFNCTGCDFSGQNLSGHSFRGQRMNGSDFSRANLQNSDFSNSVMVGADFSRANLRGANFANAVLTGCDFTHADLTGVNFTGAQVTGCDVDARSLSPSQAATLIRACRTGCDFSGANLQNQDLHGVSLTGVDLSGADLRGANLSSAAFSGVDFSHARMDGARVDGAAFTGCDFSGVNIRSANFDKATFTGTKFSNMRP